MMVRTLLVYCVQLLVLASSSTLPEVASYAKVSINGASSRPVNPEKITSEPGNQARGFQDATISRSPIYVPPGAAKLRNGEALDHPSTKRYSTLDREAVAKLDSPKSRKVAQDRFVPHASIQSEAIDTKYPIPSYATLPQAAYSPSYDYRPNPKPMEEKPPSAPNDDFSTDSEDSYAKIPDSYQQPEIYTSDEPDEAPKFPVYQSGGSYGDKYPPKPVDFPGDFDRPSFTDDSYGPHEASHHDYHHDLIYDHPPDHDLDHHHHHHHRPRPTTTEEPEMEDERLSKRPYSYYYIGKKLWYIPLYFSIYFIIYIAALILKSIARHKINFPASLAAAAEHNGRAADGPGWLDLAKRVFDGIDVYNSLRERLDHS